MKKKCTCNEILKGYEEKRHLCSCPNKKPELSLTLEAKEQIIKLVRKKTKKRKTKRD